MNAPTVSSAISLAAEESPPIIPVVGELIVGFIAFGILCFILMRYVFPKMEQTYRARVDAIEGGLQRAEQAQAQAQQLLERYQAQLAQAHDEAIAIRDEAREQGQHILADLRAQAQEESTRIIARGEQQLATSRQQLIVELRTEIGQLSVELASRIVGESLADEARRAGTVERFLDELERGNTDSSGAELESASRTAAGGH
jgi:F-type H+-transporting ATPase subunit b